MGLIAGIYKHNGRSFSNGGLSERVNDVTIVNAEGPFTPNEDRPAVMLVKGNLPGTVKAVMATEVVGSVRVGSEEKVTRGWEPMRMPHHVGPMHGGCFIETSDSRFGELVARLGGQRYGGPVPLHDRFETPAQYRAMSA